MFEPATHALWIRTAIFAVSISSSGSAPHQPGVTTFLLSSSSKVSLSHQSWSSLSCIDAPLPQRQAALITSQLQGIQENGLVKRSSKEERLNLLHFLCLSVDPALS
ncbi:MAG: hypothetical protein EZS28_013389 [Streblomastix strix]|uniref:Uncharacterized protein n=1 Tax=Streblomastix strix TaxID=222440 RepID=A0A5J4W8X2_9EUKA|nr:MAG: hypothetical protein EZS28_013389 [Streblomastix strix]